jgi:hypothetical protein
MIIRDLFKAECNCGENSFCAQNYLTKKLECRCNAGFAEDFTK